MPDFTVEVNQDGGSIRIDAGDILEYYERGGVDAVRDFIQDEIDNYVRNNIVAVVIDSEVDEAIEQVMVWG